jgi:hypothetical protein
MTARLSIAALAQNILYYPWEQRGEMVELNGIEPSTS